MSRVRRIALAATLFVVIVAAVACTPNVSPRSGRVLYPGGIAAEFRGTPFAWGTGTVELTKRTGDVERVDANTTRRFDVAPGFEAMFWSWFELSLRLGLVDPCELGIEWGVMQMGGEIRCGLLDDRRGDPLSLAIGGSVLHMPVRAEQSLVYRLSADLGRALSPDVELIGGLAVLWGAQGHAVTLDGDDVDEKFLADDGDPFFGDLFVAPSYAYIERDELRLSGHIGTTFSFDGGQLTAALVPWAVAYAGTVHHTSCQGCSNLDPTSLAADWGVAFMTSLAPVSLGEPPGSDLPGPAPVGHHYETVWDENLVLAGAISLGLSYAPFVPIVIDGAEGSGQGGIAALWFVPIVGPIVWRQHVDWDTTPIDRGFADLGGYGTAALQGAAALMFFSAWLNGDEVLRPDEPGVAFTPTGVAGRW